MINTIRNLLGKKNADAASLRAARESIDLEALSVRADTIAAKRRAALLDGSDEAIAKLEEEEATARRDLDRGRAAIEELDRRIDAATEKEELAKWRASRAVASAKAEAAAKQLRERYPSTARELVDMILAAEAANAAVRDWKLNCANNWAHGSAEEDRAPLASVEHMLFENFHEDGHVGSLIAEVRLAELGDFAPGLHDYAAPFRGTMLKLRSGR